MISVLILTRNEERDLPGALASVSWSDDVHIFDSESTDRTQEIARQAGATVTVKRFEGYARQRNAAMQLPFKHEWVLILDADERLSPELHPEMLRAVQAASTSVGGFQIRRRDYLWGTWLKHAQITPFYVRLVRVGRVHYVRDINEVIEVAGDTLALQGHLEHLAFSKGLAHWVSKHNTYSTMEAELLASGEAVRAASLREAFFGGTFHERRVAQKAIFYKLPGRPLVKWLYMVFVRGAILDGHAGLVYATLQSFYEYLIEVKCQEMTRLKSGKPL